MSISLGIGLTTRCNCNCAHCYSRNGKVQDLDFDTLIRFSNKFNIDSVNFGTGESYLYPKFLETLYYYNERKIPVAITTNGYTVEKLSDEDLKKLNDIDFSLDYPTREMHNAFRKGDQFDSILKGIERCKKLGVECSITLCLMKPNVEYLPQMIELCRGLDVNLRINIYKPVNQDEFCLTYDQFWGGVATLLENTELISCSEPVIKTALGIENSIDGSPCGCKSIRIKPGGEIVPCVYLLDSKINISDVAEWQDVSETEFLTTLKKEMNARFELPKECVECKYYVQCKGGCESRRILTQNTGMDQYCFLNKEVKLPQPKWYTSSDKMLVHSAYLCTMIVKP